MRRFVFGLGIIAVLGALPSEVSAKKPELLPTGNTIAGPGLVTVGPDTPTLVLRQSSSTPLDLCVTLVHVGPAGTTVGGVVRDPGMVTNSSSVSTPGDAVTVCRNASDNVLIQCVSPGPLCKALWRVDQPR
jgi:hypothetical protein